MRCQAKTRLYEPPAAGSWFRLVDEAGPQCLRDAEPWPVCGLHFCKQHRAKVTEWAPGEERLRDDAFDVFARWRLIPFARFVGGHEAPYERPRVPTVDDPPATFEQLDAATVAVVREAVLRWLRHESAPPARRSRRSGAEIPEGTGARVEVDFLDGRRRALRFDLTDAEVDELLDFTVEIKPRGARRSSRA